MSRGHFVDTFNAKMLNNVLKSFTYSTKINPIKKALTPHYYEKSRLFLIVDLTGIEPVIRTK